MTESSISRRAVLLGAVGWGAACQARAVTTPSAVEGAEDAPQSEPFGGLQFATGGDLGESERGASTVVLLHGFGATGDDLVSLAQTLAHPRTRYIVPAAPIELQNGGRAWWPMRGRPTYNADQELVAPEAKIDGARVAVRGLLSTIKERFAPDSLLLVGFSQGAMLALDMALSAASGVDRVAVLSGALLSVSAMRLAKPRRTRPSVFVSHGRADPVRRFEGAEHLVQTLKSHNFRVTFRAFDGGHEIPPEALDDLKAFLFNAPV